MNGATRWSLGTAVVVLAGLMIVWNQRKPIAMRYIDQFVADHSADAHYTIVDLGLNRQRLTNVVIGDPARPDLVADWIELSTTIALDGVRVVGVRAGAVRVRGAMVDGRLRLGAIDRLLPTTAGAPFSLPALDLAIDDGRMQIDTPQGIVAVRLVGRGPLNNGFTGKIHVAADRLAIGSCTVSGALARGAIKTVDHQPQFVGPVTAATVACGNTRIDGARADVDGRLGATLDNWRGTARLAATKIADQRAMVNALTGRMDFSGSARRTVGSVAVTTDSVATSVVNGRAAGFTGRYVAGVDGFAAHGHATIGKSALTAPLQTQLRAFATSGTGTPVAPLNARLARSLLAAGRAFALAGDVDVSIGREETRFGLTDARGESLSGARFSMTDGPGIEITAGGVRANGVMTLNGGGLPAVVVLVRQAKAGGVIQGSAQFQPFAAGDARLALSSIRFGGRPGGMMRASALATLSGPIGSGRVDRAAMAISGTWDGRSRWTVNPGCTPVGAARIVAAGMTLEAVRLRLCATGGGLVRINGGRLGGGGNLAATRLGGRVGETPITLSAASARFDLARQDFDVHGLAVRLGRGEKLSVMDVADVHGRLDQGGAAGSFSAGGGALARVPLVVSDAGGQWRLDDGKLTVTGGLTVTDSDSNPRFFPLIGKDVTFALVDGSISARAALLHPESKTLVTDVTIKHDLQRGVGAADLDVSGISFDEAFQPAALTRFTYGVIADVKGKVSGAGHIRWTPDGVTSDGKFSTAGTDLAAAFGPVTGLSTEIRFTDLLNLESAPGQTATIAIINPGIPVINGELRYQTLPGSRVAIEGARWPFAGGALALDPTVLDFTESRERRLTFKVSGVDAEQFLQQFDFKNLDATGTFDGTLPMIFDLQGGRIESGTLAVRGGGGSIAYVGEVSQKDLGFWANMAFQALKSIRYRSLAIDMNGPLAGEMITEVRFAGISQGAGAKSNFLIRRLQQLPLVFNVRIAAPFRQLIDSAQSVYDPKRLIERNLPALIRAQDARAQEKSVQPGTSTDTQTLPEADKPVQPPASEPMP